MTPIKLCSAVFTLLLASVAPSCLAQPHNPYAGVERNELSALAPDEGKSLLAGHGMGYAKAAELNGYPGPLHVVELADRLALSPEQLGRTQALMNAHRSRARALGAKLVDAERALDQLFRKRVASTASVAAAAERVGRLQAQLRTEHLNTHIAQTALLDVRQIERYAELRGYAATKQGHAPADGHGVHRPHGQ